MIKLVDGMPCIILDAPPIPSDRFTIIQIRKERNFTAEILKELEEYWDSKTSKKL